MCFGGDIQAKQLERSIGDLQGQGYCVLHAFSKQLVYPMETLHECCYGFCGLVVVFVQEHTYTNDSSYLINCQLL